jgi:hypothetical protein
LVGQRYKLLLLMKLSGEFFLKNYFQGSTQKKACRYLSI